MRCSSLQPPLAAPKPYLPRALAVPRGRRVLGNASRATRAGALDRELVKALRFVAKTVVGPVATVATRIRRTRVLAAAELLPQVPAGSLSRAMAVHLAHRVVR